MSDVVRRLAKRFGFGLGLWRLRERPRAFVAELRHEGATNALLKRTGTREMTRAANHLPPLISHTAREEDAREIHFLTGRKFWYQTLFCAYSMMQHADRALRAVIYDDGTLDASCAARLRETLPNTRIISRSEIEAQLDEHLPASKFPTLRAVRLEYPHLRKLTDVHAGRNNWRLVLDSDMLFFREPRFLLDWLQAPTAPCYMADVRTAYGYSDELLHRLVGKPMPECLNVGICGLQSETIDWERAESWCKALIAAEGLGYFLEQTLTAMMLAGRACAVAPADDYIVYPARHQVSPAPEGVMHHYTGEAKAWYLRYGWRHVIAQARRQHAAPATTQSTTPNYSGQ